MEFTVVGLNEAKTLMRTRWPTSIVSLVDFPIDHQGPHHLIVNVEDTPFEEGNHPTKVMIEQVFEHTKSLTTDDTLLVHCFAGQSRSTAMMIGILINRGVPWDAAYEQVRIKRDIMLPNSLIIKLLDEHFSFGGDLIAHNKAYITKARNSTRETDGIDHRASAPTQAQIEAMRKILDSFK